MEFMPQLKRLNVLEDKIKRINIFLGQDYDLDSNDEEIETNFKLDSKILEKVRTGVRNLSLDAMV